jgi:hypothetical protein
MHRTMVRYDVRPDQVAQNEALVRAVYDELRRTRPAGLEYAAYRLGDSGSFVHLVRHETPAARSALVELPSFRTFQDGHAARCLTAPVVTELHEVGSFSSMARDAD